MPQPYPTSYLNEVMGHAAYGGAGSGGRCGGQCGAWLVVALCGPGIRSKIKHFDRRSARLLCQN